MAFYKQTVRDIDIKDKRVLMRVDYNVPIENGKVTSDFRIVQSLPTIKFLQEQGCKIVLLSHLGRPDGKPDAKYSLRPAAECLGQLLEQEVAFSEDCIGANATNAVAALESGQILVLENVRFHPEEEAKDEASAGDFARKLAAHGDIFVQDAFGVVHHGAVSVSELPKYLPAVAGLLLEKEVDTITGVMEAPERPLAAIIGGAKIADKIKVLHRFIEIADFIAIGGAMANTFLLALGIETGKSLTEPDDVPIAKEIIEKAKAKAAHQPFVLYLPQDGVVATDMKDPKSVRIVDWDAHVIANLSHFPKQPPRQASQVQPNELILDIGPFSGSFIAGSVQLARTVVWNGTMGVTETVGKNNDPVGPFAYGTELIVEALMGHFGNKPFSLVGGGDTVAYVEERGMTNAFHHVSTGGGASLELLEGKKLPGVEALLDKEW
jgi:3-phosphoglycerate kinase